jgi:hypothetical protein
MKGCQIFFFLAKRFFISGWERERAEREREKERERERERDKERERENIVKVQC